MLRAPGPLGPPPGRLLLPDAATAAAAAAAALRLLPPLPGMEPVPKGVLGAALGKPRRPVIACSVCQIRFNSESQAAAHYQGNRHARRLKGLEAARARRGGDSGDTQDTPGPAPAPAGETPDRAGWGSQGCPVNPPRAGRRAAPGTRSPRRPRAPLAPCSPPGCGRGGAGGGHGGGPGGEEEEEKAKAKRLLYCALCKVAVNSLSQLEAHNKGTKHKTLVEARSGLGPIRAFPRLGGAAGTPPAEAPERSFHCQICNVRLNSELQLKQHISSRRHRDGVAGKPNPLLSRHKKPWTPPGAEGRGGPWGTYRVLGGPLGYLWGGERALGVPIGVPGGARGAGGATPVPDPPPHPPQAPLPFPKELPKALAAGGGLLPPPLALAAAAAAMAAPPLALRPPGPPLLPGPPLAPALLRPAPGPLRPAHAPLLFSPY
ncbi:zinc finger protein 385A [Theristicus caerulescens]